MAILLILLGVLIINDYIRSFKLIINSTYMYDGSLLFTIILSSALTYFIRGFGADIYLLFPLKEILQLEGKRLKHLFLIHSLLYLLLLISDMGIPENLNILSNEAPIILNYIFLAGTIYSLNIIRVEKDDVNKLNKKLQLANIKLQQYSSEVEELTASKERTMMAQELHDSVGHTLIALILHLEFAKKMYYAKPKEVMKVLIKSETIARSSISSLRKIVSLFKEERQITSFNDSIKGIINNFHILNNIKINFNSSENLDNLSQAIKNSMYKTIKESITNSIKHGTATEINIKISIKNNNINLILTDNGIGCNNIVKSTGLLGIENRINSLNGSVNYFNNDNLGFGINICIPLLIEDI